MRRKTLNEQFPNWITGNAVFTALQSYNVPWKSDNISSILDYEYFGNHSGSKFISPLISRLNEREDISDADRITLLANIIYTTFKVNWQREYDTLSVEYDMTKNYDVTERMTNDTTIDAYGHTHNRTDNLSHTKTGTETRTPNTEETRTDNLTHTKEGTETQAIDIEETRTDNLTHEKTGTETRETESEETRTPALTTTSDVYGFNSASAVHAGIQGTTGTETNGKDVTETLTHAVTDEDTGTQTNAREGSDTLTYDIDETNTGTQKTALTGTDTMQYNTTNSDTGTQSVAEGGQDTHTRNYSLSRKGNIGLTPMQKLVADERELWLWNFFLDVVFPDVDKILTIPIY